MRGICMRELSLRFLASSTGVRSRRRTVRFRDVPERTAALAASQEPLARYSREADTSSEYQQICRAVATGFAIMGVIGYVVKLVHIPIVRLLVGGALAR